MDYQLLKEDEHSYHLKDPKGKTLRIAKQSISDALHEKIRGYSSGGKVAPASLTKTEDLPEADPLTNQLLSSNPAEQIPEEPSFAEKVATSENPGQTLAQGAGYAIGQGAKGLYDVAAPVVKDAALNQVMGPLSFASGLLGNKPEAPQTGLQASNSPGLPANGVPVGGEATLDQGTTGEAQPPVGTKASMAPNILGLENQMIGAIGAKGRAESDLAKGEEQAYANYNQQLQQTQEHFQKNYQDIEGQIQKYSDEVANGKINPNKVWQDSSTGGKISAAIGLVLGGMGAGLTGGPNQALQVIQKAVDRDIDAQKANLGKSQSLLSMNMQRYQNLHAAEAATRATMGAAVQGQIAQMSAKAQSPIAAANAQLAQAQVSQAMIEPKMRMAMWQSASQTGNPSLMIRAVVPDGQQQKAYEELKSMQELDSGKQAYTQAFDKLNEMGTVMRTMKPAQRDALINPILTKLSKDTAGRFTDSDAEYLKSLFPAALDSDSTIKTKRAQGVKLLQEKMHSPLLDSFGVKYKTNPLQVYRPGDFKK
jgi:hypothetical protein